MENIQTKSVRQRIIRKRIAKLIPEPGFQDVSRMTASEAQRFIHGLCVKQAEFQTRVEELRCLNQELEAARNKYQNLFNHAPSPYFIVDEHNNIEEVNAAAERLLGADRASLRKIKITSFMPTKSAELYYLYRRKALEANDVVCCEMEMKSSTGAIVFVELQILAPDKVKKELRIGITDISERRSAEVSLKETWSKIDKEKNRFRNGFI